ncbi:MAG: NAD(P)/FAD-dependent oxidoreductase [Thermoleophilia bacterium]
MTTSYDVAVIGAGPAGEVAVGRLAAAGMRVALIERELVGGECAYWACIPSKTLLRPPEARAEARRVAGVAEPSLAFDEIAAYRDEMIRHLDDSAQVDGYREMGVAVHKGAARALGPGRLEVDGEVVEAERIVVATGSEQSIPPIDGLAEAGYWTNREATTAGEVPESLVVLGGGPVGVELGQLYRRLGAEVTIVQAGDGLVPREDVAVGEIMAGVLRDEGVDLRLGARAVSVALEGSERVVQLDGGGEVRGRELLVATGRRPRVAGLDLERLGVEVGERGVTIDERCRAAEGVWAVGDVTGVMLFTHVGMYQARIACEDIAGRPARADYSAIPRVVFSDPEIAAVGLSAEGARERGLEILTSRIEIPEVIARPWTYEREPRGTLGLVADARERVLIGAWAVAPLAGEWIHQVALAVKARIGLDVLADTVAQFPTFSEAVLKGIEALEES